MPADLNTTAAVALPCLAATYKIGNLTLDELQLGTYKGLGFYSDT
jgi:hypothetical protein